MKKSLAFLMALVFFFFTLVGKSDSKKCSSEAAPKGNCRQPRQCAPLRHLVINLRFGDLTRGDVGSNCTVDGNGNKKICCPIIPVECTITSTSPPLVQKGTCETILDCPELRRLQTGLPFTEFDDGYGGECPPDGENVKRWCCPIVAENCTSSSYNAIGRCRLLKDCPVIHHMIETLSAVQFLENYGGCGRGRAGGSVRICCPPS